MKYAIITCLSLIIFASGCVVTDQKLEARLAEVQQEINSNTQTELEKSRKAMMDELKKFSAELKKMNDQLTNKSKELDKTADDTSKLVESKYSQLDTKLDENQKTVNKFGELYDQLDKIRSESKTTYVTLSAILKKNWEILSSQREQLADEKKSLDERISKMDEMIIAIEDALSAINELLGKTN